METQASHAYSVLFMSSPHLPDLRILLLEDNPHDADLVAHALQRIDRSWVIERVDSENAFVEALERHAPQVILSDHSLENFRATDALRLTQSRRPTCAFLLVSGAFDLDSIACLKLGAADFIHKHDLDRLGPAIDSAMKSRAPLLKLSERQLEVLQLLASGYSTRDIAERLKVSVKTVETHRAHVMKRLGIRDVAGLVRYAIQVGVVSTHS